mgnify:CR=1 FL=1
MANKAYLSNHVSIQYSTVSYSFYKMVELISLFCVYSRRQYFLQCAKFHVHKNNIITSTSKNFSITEQ